MSTPHLIHRLVRRIWSGSIQRQLVLGTALIHAALLLLFVFDLGQREQATLQAQSVSYTQHSAEALARSSSSCVLAMDTVALENVLNFKTDDLLYAMVVTPTGEVLGHTDRGLVGRYLDDDISSQLLGAHPSIQHLTVNEHLIDIAAPILTDGRLIGWARVANTQKTVHAAQHTLARNSVLYALLASLVGPIFALVMARRLTGDIRRLLSVIHRFKEGHGTPRADLTRSDEIGQLGRALDQTFQTLIQQQDLTRAAQVKVNAEHLRLVVTLKSIADGVITTDIDGRVFSLNPAAERLTGWSSAEATGRLLDEVFQVSDDDHTDVLAVSLPDLMEQNLVLQPRDGAATLHIFESCGRIRDADGTLTGMVVVFRDTTHERQVRAQTFRMRSLESIGLLAGGIAHDFNNILTGILGNVGLAGLYAQDNPEAVELLEAAEKAGLRAKDLTQRLLTFSQGGSPIIATASLPELLHSITSFSLSGTNVRCEYQLADDLSTAYMDRGQLSQVIQNLVINAVQAMPKGGTLTIAAHNVTIGDGTPSALPPGPYVQVAVSDTGVGIPEDALEHIFDPYFSTKDTGKGLGLAISHSIITKHKGELSVRSKLGAGTTFTFSLRASTEPVIARRVTPSTPPQRPGATVLIMDDEDPIVRFADRALTQQGYRVLRAADGEAALEILKAEQAEGRTVDVALMDLTIPGAMGGLTAAPLFSQETPNLRMVVSSGYSNDPVLAKPDDFGFCGVLPKPYTREQLLACIVDALDGDLPDKKS